MNETTKTISFIAVGGILAACAAVVHFTSQPKSIKEFAFVGTEFYPDFSEPQKAQFLEVAAYDEKKGEAKTFRVEQKDGVWRIPSHHNYPAEAKDRLVKTATSVIGIERKALAGRRVSDHKRFGVIDPLAEEISDPEAVGKRVMIGVSDEDVLADYIVGKRVEEDEIAGNPELREIRGEKESEPLFYVRRPDEKETYIADLNIEVSTKFSDWIEPDLLRLEESDIRELVIDKYSIEYKEKQVRRGPIVMLTQVPVKSETETHHLSREGGFGTWKLEGMDEEGEELETSKVSSLSSNVAGLKILGVRPRYQYDGKSLLDANLEISLPEELLKQGNNVVQSEMSEVQSDLSDHGFSIDVDETADEPIIKLLSDKGEMAVGTEAGLVYYLHFGSVFLGSDTEIEFGGEDNATDENADKNSEAEKKDKKSEESDTEQKKSRFLLVRVKHDPLRVEGKPTEPIPPIEPTKPAPESPGDEPEKPPVKNPDEAEDKNGEGEKLEKREEDTGESSDEPGTVPDSQSSSCDFVPEQDDENETADKTEKSADGEAADGTETKVEKSDAGESDTGTPDDPKESNSEAAESTGDDDQKVDDNEQSEETKKLDPEAEHQAAMQKYLADKQQYSIDLEQYKKGLKEHEKKVADSKNKADELNERFADWYYVISAEDLENLRLSRSDLVKPKEKTEEEKTGDKEEPGFDPSKLLPDIPGLDKPETNSTPEKKEPSTEEKDPAAEEKDPTPETKE